MDDRWRETLRAVLTAVPAAATTLAAQAGISPTTLERVLSGERALAPHVVTALLHACEQHAEAYGRAAQRLRSALHDELGWPSRSIGTVVVDPENYILGCTYCGALWIPDTDGAAGDQWACPKACERDELRGA
jgi:hypothetical protein